MKSLNFICVLGLTVGLVIFFLVPGGFAHDGYGMHHNMWEDRYERGSQWSYCPYCGSRFTDRDKNERVPGYGMRQDHWSRRGHGMGPGMMGPGYRQGYNYPENRHAYRDAEPLEIEDAREIVKNMLKESRNPNLKIGAIEEKETIFVVNIITKKGDVLVDRVQVHKESGMMRSEYQQ
jgi:hypothetical protein